MFQRAIDTAFSRILLTLTFTYLAFSTVLRGFRRLSPAPARRPQSLRPHNAARIPVSNSAGEFDFHRAIPAYEELIDSAAELRR